MNTHPNTEAVQAIADAITHNKRKTQITFCGVRMEVESIAADVFTAILAAKVPGVTITNREMYERMPDAARDVVAERLRQITKEGWTPDLDDEHRNGELADAAACYAAFDNTSRDLFRHGKTYQEQVWPSDWTLKRKDRRSNLVRAGALILAEIERIDRAAARAKT